MKDSDIRRLKAAMGWAEMTATALAAELGVSRSMVTQAMEQIEHGGGWPPSVSRERVATVLGIEPSQLQAGGPVLAFGGKNRDLADEFGERLSNLEISHMALSARLDNLAKGLT